MLNLVYLQQGYYRCNTIDQTIYKSLRRNFNKERVAQRQRRRALTRAITGHTSPAETRAKLGTIRNRNVLPRNTVLKQPPPSTTSTLK